MPISASKRRLMLVLIVLLWLLTIGALLWAMGAIIYDFPWPAMSKFAAFGLLIGCGMIACRIRGPWRKLLGFASLILLILLWWFSLRPSNQRNWQ